VFCSFICQHKTDLTKLPAELSFRDRLFQELAITHQSFNVLVTKSALMEINNIKMCISRIFYPSNIMLVKRVERTMNIFFCWRQVFVTDKKKMKAYGLKDKPNRIKKGLTQELKAINPGERVIFVGTTSKPQVQCYSMLTLHPYFFFIARIIL